MRLRRTALVVASFAALTGAIIAPLGLGALRIELVEVVERGPVGGYDTSGHWLPPWFGDASAPPGAVRGVVFAAELPVRVHLGLDVPDPGIWVGRDVTTDATGHFDFGPQRRGSYLVQAYGPAQRSRVVAYDATATATATAAAHALELFSYPCQAIDRLALHVDGFHPHELIVSACGRPSDGPMRFTEGRGIPFTGRVMRADRGPVGGLGVAARVRGMHGMWGPTPMIVTTDRDGRFKYDRLWRGEYDFSIVSGLQAWRMYAIDLRHAGAVVDLALAGPPHPFSFGSGWGRERDDPDAAWVRGRVVSAGQPVPDAEIEGHVLSGAGGWHDDLTYSHADGTFDLFVSSTWLDAERTLRLRAEQRISELEGRTEVSIRPGDDLDGIVIELSPR